MVTMSFSNKVVVVTGSSQGIGAGIAISFAKEGADVVIIGRNTANLEKVAKTCEEHGSRPLIIVADISKEEDTRSIIPKTMARFNRLDVVVTCAAHYNEATILNGDIVQAYDEIMNVNLRSIVLLTSLAAPHLIKTKGNIINISSIPALTWIMFSVSKAALDHFTKCAALELAPHGVRLNTVNPGFVKSDSLLKTVKEDSSKMEYYKQVTPFKKLAEVEEVADLVLYLASDKAVSITGSSFVIDNGTLLQSAAGI